MAVSIIPSPHKIVHIPKEIDSDDIDPATGNPLIVPQAPIVRRAMAIEQFGRRGSSRQVVSGEFLDRTETELHMAVADPTLYNPLDQVFINPTLDCNDNWTVGSGTAYWVDGVGADDRQGPWPAYLKQFGGTVKLRRVS